MSLLRTTLLAAVACIVAVAFAAGTASAGGPTAHAAAHCKDLNPGDGYIVNITTRHVGCATGRKVASAHRSCRLKHGKRGRCTSKVRGYRCKEGHRNSISTQFTAKVKCTRGSKRVSFVYQQNT